MKKLLILALFSTSSLFGIEINGVIYNHDNDYSFKNFQYRNFIDDIQVDLSGKVIAGTNFSREQPGSIIFPETMTGVTFVKCDLSNIVIPEGNQVIECSTQAYQVQNDREDWYLDDETKTPKRPVREDLFKELNISIDPADIPVKLIKESITTIKQREKQNLEQVDKLQAEIVELQKPVPVEPVDDKDPAPVDGVEETIP